MLGNVHSLSRGVTVVQIQITPPTLISLLSFPSRRILLRKKIRRLPVVDKDGHVVGLLSRRDIVGAALKMRKERAAAL